MGKSYYRALTGVFFLALVICLGARAILFSQYTDYTTGFYTRETGIITVYNICYWAAVLFLFVANRLRRTEGDYPLPQQSIPTAILALLCAAAIALFTLIGEPYPFIEQNHNPTIIAARGIVSLVLGLMAAISFLLFGIAGLRGNLREKLHQINWVPALLASVWQVFMLVSRFNSYTTLTTITDNLLAVMFMVFATLFLLGHARTSLGFAHKDGRNYVIPAGLCAGMTGILLVVPNYVVMAMGGTLDVPALMLGLWESVYILLLSVYAIVYVAGTIRSIKLV